MKIYKITYNEADTINIVAHLDAKDAREAVTIFTIENPNADVIKVEEVAE